MLIALKNTLIEYMESRRQEYPDYSLSCVPLEVHGDVLAGILKNIAGSLINLAYPLC